LPPKYLRRDRDGIYGRDFQCWAPALGLEELRTAPRSPWQSPYVERLIGSVRRECFDHVIVLNQAHRHRLLTRLENGSHNVLQEVDRRHSIHRMVSCHEA